MAVKVIKEDYDIPESKIKTSRGTYIVNGKNVTDKIVKETTFNFKKFGTFKVVSAKYNGYMKNYLYLTFVEAPNGKCYLLGSATTSQGTHTWAVKHLKTNLKDAWEEHKDDINSIDDLMSIACHREWPEVEENNGIIDDNGGIIVDVDKRLKGESFRKLKPCTKTDYYGFGGMITEFPDGSDALIYYEDKFQIICGWYDDKEVLVEIGFEEFTINKTFSSKEQGIKYAEQMISMLHGATFVSL